MYSDESFGNRFSSIGVTSGDRSSIEHLRAGLTNILTQHETASVQFKEISGHSKKEKAAKAFIDLGIEYVSTGKIRVDVLSWGLDDSRHTVAGMDDSKNHQLMYGKILKWAQICWKHKTLSWQFFPDRYDDINWGELMRVLDNISLDKEILGEDIFGKLHSLKFAEFVKHDQSSTSTDPVLQLTDIFTGFAVFSCEHGRDFLRWRSEEYRQLSMFDNTYTKNFSKRVVSKFRVLDHLDKLCKQRKMYVSLKTEGHLKTFSPKSGLNFWHYEPQHPDDKAPLKIN